MIEEFEKAKEILDDEEVVESEDKRPKILWLSDLVAPTGFSRVSHSVIKFLEKDFNITGLGINYHGDPHKYTFPIYPAAAGGRVYGEDKLLSLLKEVKFDILYILNDAWVVDRYLDVIKKGTIEKDRPKIVVYFPVDSEFHQPEWYKNFDIVTTAVTYTEYGRGVVNHPLCVPELILDIIPHGTDSGVFYKKYTNRRDAKIQLFRNNEAGDDFIFLNANRNQPRKRLDITMEAFKLFADGKENVKLYMHSGIVDAHIDLGRMSKRLEIDNKLILTSLNQGIQRVPEQTLNDIYNACDVGINTCYVKGTKVLTQDGYKPIENIGVGDIVFSHTGKISKVIKTFIHENRDNLIKITPWGAFQLTLTGNHELFADQRQYTHLLREYKNETRDNPNLKFIRADTLLVGSVLTFPVIKEESVSVGEGQAFIYGAYLAEGSASGSGIRFSLNSSKDEFLRNSIIKYMKDVFGLDAHIYEYSRNRQSVEFNSVKLKKEFAEMFGTGAKNKSFPGYLLHATKTDKISLLKGHFLGDGHLSHKSGTLTFTTMSENLAWGIFSLLTTLGKIAPSISQRTRGEWCVRVNGESARELSNLFSLELKSKHRQQRDKMWADENYIYYPIKSIENIYGSQTVYDLEVDGEHSYVTHISGHNSMGEGWGLTSIEHAITKSAQIVPNHSACAEIFMGCGELVNPKLSYTFDHSMTVGKLVDPVDVAISMEKLYTDTTYRETLEKKAFEKFSDPKYSWKEIANRWNNVFLEAINR